MSKDRSEIRTEGYMVFYAVLFERFKKAALDCGYALALHGSMNRDLDMIAAAWDEDAKDETELVKNINDCIDGTVWKERNLIRRTIKNHGRICYTLSIMGDLYIDLSVYPPINQFNPAPKSDK